MNPDFMGQGSETMCIICVTPRANLWCNSLNNVIYFEMQMKNKFNYVLFVYIQFYFAWIFKIWIYHVNKPYGYDKLGEMKMQY